MNNKRKMKKKKESKVCKDPSKARISELLRNE
jgi:hypothetical protein